MPLCTSVPPHTSLRMRVRMSSFRPIVNSIKVMPRDANSSSRGVASRPSALRTKPAIRNPINGGKLNCRATRPNTNAIRIQRKSISCLYISPENMAVTKKPPVYQNTPGFQIPCPEPPVQNQSLLAPAPDTQ